MKEAEKLKTLKHRLAVNIISAGKKDKEEIERLKAKIEKIKKEED